MALEDIAVEADHEGMSNKTLRVGDVMTAPAVTVSLDTPSEDIATRMLDERISAVPVVDEVGMLRGIVTASDLALRAAYGKSNRSGLALVAEIIQGPPAPWVDRFNAQTAQTLMTKDVVTATPEESVVVLARRMLQHRHTRVPVVNNGRVVGVVARRDVLRLLTDEHPSSGGQLSELSAAECLRLLASRSFGRIGFIIDGRPVILPVNYTVSNGLVVVRTDPGQKLDEIPMRRIAFEVDDPCTVEPWSVLVQGHAREVTTALGDEYEHLRAAPIHLQAPGVKDHWIAIEITEISGRRLARRATESRQEVP
jgi:CBS domain-containing protein